MTIKETLVDIENRAELARDVAEQIYGTDIYCSDGDFESINNCEATFKSYRYSEPYYFYIPVEWIEMTQDELRTFLTDKKRVEDQAKEERTRLAREAEEAMNKNRRKAFYEELKKEFEKQ